MDTTKSLQFIDIGANLTDKMFSGIYNNSKKHEQDLEYVLHRAKQNHVEKIIITCGSLKEIDRAQKICETYDPESTFLYMTVGVHPTNCVDFIDRKQLDEKENIAKKEYEVFAESCKQPDNLISKELDIPGFMYDAKDLAYLEKLKEKIKNNKRIVCIGEMGLDFDRLFFCPQYLQIKYFVFQLKIVEQFKLPLFLHMRNCSKIFFDIFDKYKSLFEQVGGVIHSFTDNEAVVEKIKTYKNLFIGINGCSLKTSENINTVKKIPMEILLLETDAPWCGVKATHASYPYIKEKFENRKYTNLRKIKGIFHCNNMTIFKERNEPFNIGDIAEITYKIKESEISYESFCAKIRNNTLNLFKRLK